MKDLQGINISQLILVEKPEIKHLGHETPKKCYSPLKGVKTSFRSKMSQDLYSALAMLCGKLMIENIVNFNDKLTDKFANTKKMESLYK